MLVFDCCVEAGTSVVLVVVVERLLFGRTELLLFASFSSSVLDRLATSVFVEILEEPVAVGLDSPWIPEFVACVVLFLLCLFRSSSDLE